MLLEKDLLIAPSDLGPKLNTLLFERLCAQVEGKSYGKYGYVVKVNRIEEEHTDRGKAFLAYFFKDVLTQNLVWFRIN